MRAEIICVGSELLLGDIVDTNTQYLARRLSALGIDLYFSTSVGDNLGRLVDCLRRAISRSDLVLTSGGLGPTDDDLTRDGIAELFGETAQVDEALATDLRRFFALRRLEMTSNNLKQASLIPSARAVPNARGTAPGWWVVKGGKTIIAMPGPPGELHYMWEHEVEPGLGPQDSAIRSRTLKLFNISESSVDELLKPLTPSANPTVAVYAKQDGIHVRITAKAANAEAALCAIAPIEAKARVLLGDVVWGADDDSQESVAAAMLVSRGFTLAVAETITCGHLSTMLADKAGDEAWFRGGLVIREDAGRNTSAQELARLSLQQFDADIGVGVCGGPLPGADSPLDELTVSVVRPKASLATEASFRSRHNLVRFLGAYYALHELRKSLSRG